MQIMFNHFLAENFCSLKKLEFDFGDRTFIKGQNGKGKTTIKKAIFWVLNCKDENGKEVTGIRPHNEEGIDIDDVEVVVSLTCTFDAKKVNFRKVFRQKRNKNGEFTGNVTDYYINDIPKTAAEYDIYISEYISSSDLELCLNPFAFLSKDTKGRREILTQKFANFTNADVIDKFPEFLPLAEKLDDGSIAELIKRCNLILKGNKDRKGLYKELDEIQPRIDEVLKQKVDIDVAEWELAKAELEKKLEINLKAQADVNANNKVAEEISSKLMQLQFEKSSIQRELTDIALSKQTEFERKLGTLEYSLKSLEMDIQNYDTQITSSQNRIDSMIQSIAEYRTKWTEENAKQFDATSVTCPVCGQEYPEDRKEQMKADFESHKSKTLDDITKSGTALDNSIKELKATIVKLSEEQSKRISDADELKKQIEGVKAEQSEYLKTAKDVDFTMSERFNAICKEIEETENKLKGLTVDNSRIELKAEETAIRDEITNVTVKINSVGINTKLDERVEELNQERIAITERIGLAELELDLLKRFDRVKNEMLQDMVNSNFEFVQFRLFETQVNGDLKDVCSPTFNGESYDRNLNTGFKMLVELDVCRAFQKINNVVMPLFADNVETIDKFRIPKTEGQLICIEHTDDKELKVEVEKND